MHESAAKILMWIKYGRFLHFVLKLLSCSLWHTCVAIKDYDNDASWPVVKHSLSDLSTLYGAQVAIVSL